MRVAGLARMLGEGVNSWALWEGFGLQSSDLKTFSFYFLEL